MIAAMQTGSVSEADYEALVLKLHEIQVRLRAAQQRAVAGSAKLGQCQALALASSAQRSWQPQPHWVTQPDIAHLGPAMLGCLR